MYRSVKRIARPLLEGKFALPVPKKINGHLVWTQVRLLNADPPETHILQWIAETVSSGSTFFDVGAHYGWMSIAGAQRVGPAGRVIAFEAAPVLVDVLRYHKRMNRLSQLGIVQAAISSASNRGAPFFLLNGGLSCRNSLTIGEENACYVKPQDKTCLLVDCISLDEFVARSGIVPRVVKIDVEGGELLVLRGAERVLATHRPLLILGVHPYWLPTSHSVEQIHELLRKHRYRIRDEHTVYFDGGYLADYVCAPDCA